MKLFFHLQSEYRNRMIKLLLLISLASFPLMGGDCGNSVIGGNPGELAGKWQLVYMTGYLEDVCMGEVVNYFTNGTVTLQCPGEQMITRSYSVSDNVLTYSPSGLQYDITSLTTNSLILTGRNVARTLTYNKLPADALTKTGSGKGNNSSEINQ